MFFRTLLVLLDGIKSFIRGIFYQRAQNVGTLVQSVLRSFSFANVEGGVGFDLVDLKLHRSRDHNLPSYKYDRQTFRGLHTRSVSDITSSLVV